VLVHTIQSGGDKLTFLEVTIAKGLDNHQLMSTAEIIKPPVLIAQQNVAGYSTFSKPTSLLDQLDDEVTVPAGADDVCADAEADGVWDHTRPEPAIPDATRQVASSDDSAEEYESSSQESDGDEIF
jgi:hypothetical protein